MSLAQKVVRWLPLTFIFFIPLLVLYGWTFHNVYFTSILPTFTPMNPVTASCFLACACYLFLECAPVAPHVPERVRHLVRRIVAGMCLLVGGLLLLKYGTGIDIPIDRIFFTSRLGINRMAPATAADFFMLGSALLLPHAWRFARNILYSAVILVALYAIAAYLYNFVGVYGHSIYNPVALHTAVMFVLVGSYLYWKDSRNETEGIWLWKVLSHWFLNLSIIKKFLYGFGTVVIIMVLFSAYALYSINSITRIYQAREQSIGTAQLALKLEVDTLQSRLNFENFLKTGDPSYASAIPSVRAQVAAERAELRQDTKLPETITLLNEYEASLPQRVSLADSIIAAVLAKKPAASYQSLLDQRNELIDQSKTYLSKIADNEAASVAGSAAKAQNELRTIEVNLTFLSIIVLFLITVLSIMTTRSILQPVEQLKSQAARLAKGDWAARSNVTTRDDLGLLAHSVDEMADSLQKRTVELEREKVKDEAILSSIGDGVMVADTAGKIIYWNAAAQTLLGMPTDGSTPNASDPHAGVFYVDEKTPVPSEDQAFARALKGERVEAMSIFLRHSALPNGRFLSVTAQPVRLASGELIGAVAIFHDITKEHEVDKSKTEFVSLASHQLRTPLTSIKWYVELLLEDSKKLTKAQREYAHEIQEAMVRMNTLVAALLDVSRLDLGTFIIEPEPADLIHVMQGAVDEQAPLFPQKKQTFTFTHPESVPQIPIDEKLLHIIVQNLLSNAYKYTPEGGTITLSLEKTAEGYNLICADNGYGIPKGQQNSVFKKLFRADNIRTLDVEGTGLGLYIIKTIVEAAGCSISFVSEEGKGTTFTIHIPQSGMKAKEGTKALSGTL